MLQGGQPDPRPPVVQERDDVFPNFWRGAAAGPSAEAQRQPIGVPPVPPAVQRARREIQRVGRRFQRDSAVLRPMTERHGVFAELALDLTSVGLTFPSFGLPVAGWLRLRAGAGFQFSRSEVLRLSFNAGQATQHGTRLLCRSLADATRCRILCFDNFDNLFLFAHTRRELVFDSHG